MHGRSLRHSALSDGEEDGQASELFLCCVRPFEAGGLVMLAQVRFECKAFAAALARVVLEGRVRLRVGSQVGAVSEGLAAVSAGERFLAGVRPHVALQQPGSAEGLTTQQALVLQVVSQHVHGERWH